VKVNPSVQFRVCSNKKIKSTSRREWEVYKMALHVPECFKIYHMKKDS